MRSVSEDLHRRGVERLMVEGGATIHTQFLTEDLADRGVGRLMVEGGGVDLARGDQDAQRDERQRRGGLGRGRLESR